MVIAQFRGYYSKYPRLLQGGFPLSCREALDSSLKTVQNRLKPWGNAPSLKDSAKMGLPYFFHRWYTKGETKEKEP